MLPHGAKHPGGLAVPAIRVGVEMAIDPDAPFSLR
jgi:hypothetical protein